MLALTVTIIVSCGSFSEMEKFTFSMIVYSDVPTFDEWPTISNLYFNL